MAFDSADWMSLLPGSKKLSEFSIPGTHDSASAFQKRIKGEDRLRLATQTRGLEAQLGGGIRFLDFRCALAGSQLVLHQEEYSLDITFDSVLDIMRGFLRAHPAETIVLSLMQEGSNNRDGFANGFRAYVDRGPDLWFLGNEIPFLSTVRGKIVLFRRFDRATGDTRELGIDAFGNARFPDNRTPGTGTSSEPTAPPKLYIQNDSVGPPGRNRQSQADRSIDSKTRKVMATLDLAESSSDRDVLYVNFTTAAVKDPEGTATIVQVSENLFPITVANHVNPMVRQYFNAKKQGRFGVLPRGFEATDLSSPLPQTLDPVNQLIIQTNLTYYSLQQKQQAGVLAVDFGDGLDDTLLLAKQTESGAPNQALVFVPSDRPPYLYLECTGTNTVIDIQGTSPATGLPLVAFRKVQGRDSQLWKIEPSLVPGSFFITSKVPLAGSITTLGPAPGGSGLRLHVGQKGVVSANSQLWSVVKSS